MLAQRQFIAQLANILHTRQCGVRLHPSTGKHHTSRTSATAVPASPPHPCHRPPPSLMDGGPRLREKEPVSAASPTKAQRQEEGEGDKHGVPEAERACASCATEDSVFPPPPSFRVSTVSPIKINSQQLLVRTARNPSWESGMKIEENENVNVNVKCPKREKQNRQLLQSEGSECALSLFTPPVTTQLDPYSKVAGVNYVVIRKLRDKAYTRRTKRAKSPARSSTTVWSEVGFEPVYTCPNKFGKFQHWPNTEPQLRFAFKPISYVSTSNTIPPRPIFAAYLQSKLVIGPPIRELLYPWDKHETNTGFRVPFTRDLRFLCGFNSLQLSSQSAFLCFKLFNKFQGTILPHSEILHLAHLGVEVLPNPGTTPRLGLGSSPSQSRQPENI
ncbi:hypothetical protein C8F04DRAFT_1188010 [Mycena alexandri]|uniref:Uncharacterized protein n=1 Tax=Mycena alexandri TaxID=1745969 RepID=A0AAD6SMM5_9AGAR|nr:hypothetical protein C8F04DRAFT_1188010 [Mycena alexandri]